MVVQEEMFCVVITDISASQAPVDIELPLLGLVLDPIVTHVDFF